MARFDSEITVAKNLIAENGENSTLRRTTRTANSVRPWETDSVAATDTTVKAVWLNYKIDRLGGDVVKSGDMRVLIAGASVTTRPDPARDHLIRASEEKWNIISVEPLEPNGQKILYSLQVRK